MAVVITLLLISVIFLPPLMISAAAPPSFPPYSVPELDHRRSHSPTVFASILASRGFQDLSSAALEANLTSVTPITIFALSDSSLLTCPTCSLPLLLQEHSVPGLYSVHYLRNLAFGTKLETLASEYCLTVTSSTAPGLNDSSKLVFVNGVEITHPDLFYDGAVLVHGLQGFVSHLSPLSCNVERLTSISFPIPTPGLFKAPTTAAMLKDAVIRLHNSGYSVVSLALKVNFDELSKLESMTVFALDDVSIFSGAGQAYLSHFRFHVVPNRRLTAADLVSLPPTTVLATMEEGQKLVVKTAGGGGPLVRRKVDYLKVSTMDLVENSRIGVHAVSPAEGSSFSALWFQPPCMVAVGVAWFYGHRQRFGGWFEVFFFGWVIDSIFVIFIIPGFLFYFHGAAVMIGGATLMMAAYMPTLRRRHHRVG